MLYEELRRRADQQLREWDGKVSLQPNTLVHETWLRLIEQDKTELKDRGHFLAVAAMVMRRIVIDH